METVSAFISYCSGEVNEARWVKRALEMNGISCWMAPDSIAGGTNYASEVPKAIRACDVFVLVLSKSSQESKWVPKEVDLAINESKRILPFAIDDAPLNDSFSLYLSNIQRYAAYKDKQDAMRRMISDIFAMSGDNRPVVPPKETEKVKKAQTQGDKFSKLLETLIVLSYLLFIPFAIVATITYILSNKLRVLKKTMAFITLIIAGVGTFIGFLALIGGGVAMTPGLLGLVFSMLGAF